MFILFFIQKKKNSGLLKPLKKFERNSIVWGDHSSILSTGFLFYTTKVIYDSALFLTDEEYFKSTGRRGDVQSMVAQPQIYIVANCKDAISETLSFSEIR